MKKHETLFEVGESLDRDLEESSKKEEELKTLLRGCSLVRARVKSKIDQVNSGIVASLSSGTMSADVALAVASFLRDVLDEVNAEVATAEKTLAIQAGSSATLAVQVDKIKKAHDAEISRIKAEEAAAAYAPILEAKVNKARAAAETLRAKKKKATQ